MPDGRSWSTLWTWRFPAIRTGSCARCCADGRRGSCAISTRGPAGEAGTPRPRAAPQERDARGPRLPRRAWHRGLLRPLREHVRLVRPPHARPDPLEGLPLAPHRFPRDGRPHEDPVLLLMRLVPALPFSVLPARDVVRLVAGEDL